MLLAIGTELHPVLCTFILDDGSHLQVVLEGTGDVVGGLAGLHTALDARAHPLLAENAEQGPSRLGDAGNLCDRLHLLDAADGHLGDPEGAGHVSPLASRPGRLHGATLVRAQLAGRFDSQDAGATQPGSAGDGGDAVTGLVDTDVALVAENHLV